DFYLQDGTGGIYVESRDGLTNRLAAGDMVEVSGVVATEGASANVALSGLALLGHVVLPTARSVAIDPLHEGLAGIVDFVGNADDERVEIAGIVRSAFIQDDWINGRNLVLKVITTGGQFDIRCPETGSRSVESWIDASIRVRGVASVNPQQQSIGLVIYAPKLMDIYIQAEPPPGELFMMPKRTIRSLIQFYWHDMGHRVGIEGTVLYSEPGKMLFVRDDTGAMQVFTSQREIVHRGDQVHVVGFPAPGDYAAVLNDAVFEKTGSTATAGAVTAKPEQILAGKLNCDLVTLQGTLVDHVFGSDKQGFWVKTGDTLFDAYWPATNGLPAASQFEKDSMVKLTGIALVQDSGLAKSPQTFHLLLPSAEAVAVLKQPPWLTPRRLFWTSAILAGSILLSIAWVAFLSKRKAMLEAEVVRRKRAEKDLQQAHAELEKRMTAELREEISRREKGEAEFQAVLKERTRIAQELHDTLEQGLVGIALQLDNVADVVRDDVGLAQEHLESARRLVEHSQAETRRSVWDLRSQTLEQGGLPFALDSVAAEMRAGANVSLEVVTQGTPVPLPVLIENNLFRI
ncbi:MAG TPA: histidine kinase, partial [Candidatus Binatia bacterium]|nr:histidine kinase [Candidatus Binatia bacterium]